jgi:hypothetical protein
MMMYVPFLLVLSLPVLTISRLPRRNQTKNDCSNIASASAPAFSCEALCLSALPLSGFFIELGYARFIKQPCTCRKVGHAITLEL